MSMTKLAFRGGLWLTAFSFATQAVSWIATIVVARLLSPDDYGLMAMAFVITGYVKIFYELGVGAAVIQRPHVSDQELSSLFWALILWGGLLSLLCFLFAYPTVAIFREPRLLPVTQASAGLLVLGTMSVVPSSVLRRQMRFKMFGIINAFAAGVACIVMPLMAYLGAGVWTLVGGFYIRAVVTFLMLFYLSGWRPQFRFQHHETVPYLRFGLPVVGGNSLFYVVSQAPVVFGGRAFSPGELGQYSLAMQLAVIPNDKIVSLISSVSYPVFSRLQDDHAAFSRFYLRLSELIAFIVLPLYCGAIFIGGDLIPWLLGEKWAASVLPFRLLCISFLVTTIVSPAHNANTAQGRPHWGLFFNLFCAVTMTIGFYLAAASGNPNYLAIPWAAIYIPAQLAYAFITLRTLDIPVSILLEHLRPSILAAISMLLVLVFLRWSLVAAFPEVSTASAIYVVMAILVGAAWNIAFAFIFCRDFLNSLLQLARA
ncbi:MAG: lipopolysaccharide biosynthesis protein [Planctomycetaceae bacterium]|nr:lipopolysaccharide biosynthesis protein [Planctomycetaceae bacterium]